MDLCHHQMKPLVPGMGYIESSNQLNWPHGNPQTINLAIAKAIGCLPQTDSKGLLLKTTTIPLIEQRVDACLEHARVHGPGRYSSH